MNLWQVLMAAIIIVLVAQVFLRLRPEFTEVLADGHHLQFEPRPMWYRLGHCPSCERGRLTAGKLWNVALGMLQRPKNACACSVCGRHFLINPGDA